MKTVSKRTLFSKNRITLVKEENKELESISYVCSLGGLFSILSSDDNRYIKNNTKITFEKERVRYESPLGFYYYKMEKVERVENKTYVPDPSVRIGSIIMVTKRNTYKLYFPISQDNIKISVDTRPWMIVRGYKAMSDHFITDLYNDLESIFRELYLEKSVVVKEHKDFYEGSKKLVVSEQGLGEFKNDLYLTIFGNPKGPRNMTDSEKILSHGFDLKTSFRKDKEIKK